MKNYVLILFLITTHLFASSQANTIKVKAKQSNSIVKAKILIQGLVSPRRARSSTGDAKNAYFVKHVSANIGGDVVYDISLNNTVRQENSLVLRFDFLYKGRDDTLNFIIIDSKNKQTTRSIKIKNSLGKNSSLNSKKSTFKSINYWKEKPKLWSLTNTQEVMKELYGMSIGKANVIDVTVPEYSSYAYYVPLTIKSKIPLKSIAVFSDDLTNVSYRGKYPSIRAIISLPEGTTINYSKFYVLTSATCCEDWNVPITVAGIDRKGQVYMTVIKTQLVCSADCEM